MRDAAFRKLILSHWRRYGRHDLPWRQTNKPYRILVSEIMLQQTQVPRVLHKYGEFLAAFPTFRALAAAPTSRILNVWQGLGYNRRALMLQKCARTVVREHGGKLPLTFVSLRTLPGIGPYTAGALLAFAYGMSHPVIETNIRRVYLHHFFPRRCKVPDSEILPLVTSHLSNITSVRDWYSALMDYGSWLGKKSGKSEGRMSNPNQRSKHYVRQTAFEGSLRQLRGKILRLLAQQGVIGRRRLASIVNDPRVTVALSALQREGFVHVEKSLVQMPA